MGKRTNTILQAAFFKLWRTCMPEDEAVEYMKDAAEHSYVQEGRGRRPDMNWAAIDAGAGALVKIECSGRLGERHRESSR